MKARLYGDVSVKSVEEKEYAFYVIRKLNVTQKQVVIKIYEKMILYSFPFRSFY